MAVLEGPPARGTRLPLHFTPIAHVPSHTRKSLHISAVPLLFQALRWTRGSYDIAINNSGYFDARQSTFNHTVHDQRFRLRVHNHIVHHHVYIFTYSPRLRRHRITIDTDDHRPLLIGCPETLPQGNLITYGSSDAVSNIGAAVGLIDQITDVLMECTQPSSSHRHLALEFESLQKMLDS